MQHQTGALWVLNSLALAAVGAADARRTAWSATRPDGRPGGSGAATPGCATRIGAEPPPLAPIGRQLAACGVTAVTDASVTTDADAAARLADAHRAGELPQRLTLMSGGALAAPADGAFAVGPVKVLLDDHDLPTWTTSSAGSAGARAWGRAVAVHCVTAGELALTLAAFEAAGAQAGDRIEHGGVIPAAAIGGDPSAGPDRGHPAGLRRRARRPLPRRGRAGRAGRPLPLRQPAAAGVPVAGSSDAPYASPDPWAGMAAAMRRRTCAGAVLGESSGWTR